MPEATPHAAIPPIIDPKGHEAFPTFRETFMVYVTDPTANAAIRGFGTVLYDFLLNSWGEWPKHPEGIFRADLRAVQKKLDTLNGSRAMGAIRRYRAVRRKFARATGRLSR